MKLAARQTKEQSTGKKPRGKAPEPPEEGPRDKDQSNFTDPESRIMKMRGGFEQCYNVQAAMKRQSHGRSVAQLEVRDDPPPPPPDAPVAERMAHRLDAAEGRRLHGLRKETVEPVFGIIKQAIGFRRFLLRGKGKASLEWTLVTTSYNLKRLFNLGMSLQRV